MFRGFGLWFGSLVVVVEVVNLRVGDGGLKA